LLFEITINRQKRLSDVPIWTLDAFPVKTFTVVVERAVAVTIDTKALAEEGEASGTDEIADSDAVETGDSGVAGDGMITTVDDSEIVLAYSEAGGVTPSIQEVVPDSIA
jgi:hypothetical protein